MRPRLRGLLPRNRFARQVGVLAGGTAFGQLVVVLASPILSRIYAPGDFGVLALYGSLLTLIIVVVSLRYEQAITLPENEDDASHLLTMALALTVATSAVVALAVAVFTRSPWRSVLGAASTELLWILPIGTLLAGTLQALTQWAIRRQAFRRLAQAQMGQGISAAAGQIVLGLAGLSAAGLVLGQVLGQTAGGASLVRVARHRPMTRPLRLGAVRALAKRYRRFPLFSTWSALLVALGYSLPVVLLTSLFGAAVAGFYALGLRIVQTPLRTLGTAVSQVFLAELPAAAREDRLEALVVPALERLASVAVPSALVVMLMGPDLAVVVFGDAWREAGVYIQWITPWLALTVIGAPLAPLFTATERQRAGMVFNAAIVAGRTLALVVAARTGDPVVAIAALGVTSVALQLVMHLWLGRVASVTPGRMLSLLGMAGARPAPFLAPLVVVMLARPFPNDGPIVVGLGAALLVYFAASVLRDRAQRGAT